MVGAGIGRDGKFLPPGLQHFGQRVDGQQRPATSRPVGPGCTAEPIGIRAPGLGGNGVDQRVVGEHDVQVNQW